MLLNMVIFRLSLLAYTSRETTDKTSTNPVHLGV